MEQMPQSIQEEHNKTHHKQITQIQDWQHRWVLEKKSKFSKEASLTGNWSDKLCNIHSINEAHSFKPMHTYMLGELGTNLPAYGLPAIREDFLKKASNNPHDTFIVEKVLNRKGNKVLIKWLDYEQPTWEPISNIPKKLLTSSWKERKGK